MRELNSNKHTGQLSMLYALTWNHALPPYYYTGKKRLIAGYVWLWTHLLKSFKVNYLNSKQDQQIWSIKGLSVTYSEHKTVVKGVVNFLKPFIAVLCNLTI